MQNLIKHGISGALLVAAAAFLLIRPGFGFKDAAIATLQTPQTPVLPDHTGGNLAGVDVSHYQRTVDWPTLVASGIAFAFAKATDGITYTDPKWQTNRTASAKAGIAFGGYHFYEPNDEPAPQAANFLAALGDVENMLPPVVDLERTPEAGDEAEYLRDVQAFLSMIEDSTGCTPMIYASPSFYTQYLGTGLGQYPLWLAEYSHTAKPPQGRDWYFWQHQQNGTVDGISGSVDLDWFAGDADALASLQC